MGQNVRKIHEGKPLKTEIHMELVKSAEEDLMERFCRAFIKHIGDPSPEYKAFEETGFTGHLRRKQPKLAKQKIVRRWMQDPWVVSRIKELMKERSRRLGIDTDYVLVQAQRLLARCMGDEAVIMSKIHQGEMVEAEGYNFDAQGAARALDLIGKHVDVQAFKEKVEVDVGGDLAATLQGALARRRVASDIQDVEYEEVIENALPMCDSDA